MHFQDTIETTAQVWALILGRWINSLLLLWDPRKGTCWATVHPGEEFVFQLAELDMSTRTLLGTSCAWGDKQTQRQTGTSLGSRYWLVPHHVCAITPKHCLETGGCGRIFQKRGGHFLPANLDFSNGNAIKNANWNFAQSKARASSVHLFSSFAAAEDALSWLLDALLCSRVCPSCFPALLKCCLCHGEASTILWLQRCQSTTMQRI